MRIDATPPPEPRKRHPIEYAVLIGYVFQVLLYVYFLGRLHKQVDEQDARLDRIERILDAKALGQH